MPSTNQTGRDTASYDSEPKKMLATKNDLTIASLIRGIRKLDRAKAYYQAEIELAEEEDRNPRGDVLGAAFRRKEALKGNDTVESDVEPQAKPADD